MGRVVDDKNFGIELVAWWVQLQSLLLFSHKHTSFHKFFAAIGAIQNPGTVIVCAREVPASDLRV